MSENSNNSVEEGIMASSWWCRALQIPDRHYEDTQEKMLTGHLLSVRDNCLKLIDGEPGSEYMLELQIAIESCGLSKDCLGDIFVPVALLHDIGKVEDDKSVEIAHPISGKPTKARHQIVSLKAAFEVLPADSKYRDVIMTLVEEHDTPYSWYMQYVKTKQAPSRKAWLKLDRKLWPKGDGTGLFLLSIFKLADIDGHENVTDVIWFLDQANNNCLEDYRKLLPIPTESDVMAINKN